MNDYCPRCGTRRVGVWCPVCEYDEDYEDTGLALDPAEEWLSALEAKHGLELAARAAKVRAEARARRFARQGAGGTRP